MNPAATRGRTGVTAKSLELAYAAVRSENTESALLPLLPRNCTGSNASRCSTFRMGPATVKSLLVNGIGRRGMMASRESEARTGEETNTSAMRSFAWAAEVTFERQERASFLGSSEFGRSDSNFVRVEVSWRREDASSPAPADAMVASVVLFRIRRARLESSSELSSSENVVRLRVYVRVASDSHRRERVATGSERSAERSSSRDCPEIDRTEGERWNRPRMSANILAGLDSTAST